MKTLSEFPKSVFVQAYGLRQKAAADGESESAVFEQLSRHFSFYPQKTDWLLMALTHVDVAWIPDLKRVLVVVLNPNNWAPYYAVEGDRCWVLYEPIHVIQDPGFSDFRSEEGKREAEEEWLRKWANLTGGRTPKLVRPSE